MKKTKYQLTGALLLAAIVTGITGCQSSAKTDAEAAGAQGPQKVVVAHSQSYVPYDYVNEAGESDGFEVQVLKAVAEKLPQYEFSFVPTTDDDLLIGVESGKYNIGVKGAWVTEERKQKFLFPNQYIGASVIGLVFRSENADQIKDMESFAEYSGKLVPIAPQNAQYTIVEEYNKSHPEKPVDLIPSDAFDVTDAYSWVLEGRYDGFFNIKLSFEENVVKESGPYHVFEEQLSYVPYQAIPTWPVFNKNNQQLADDYDAALSQLKEDGTIEKLLIQYFGENIFQYVEES